MKQQTPRLLKAYRNGLRRYLKDASNCGLEDAQKLGERALGLGLETLDLAKLYEEALIVLSLDSAPHSDRDHMIRRAGTFFANAVTPIEGSHQAERKANTELKSTIDKLSQRTMELDTLTSALKEEIKRRELIESSLRTSESTSSDLFAESLHLQEELRHLSRRLLVAQEEERKRISRELHDIVAQTLTGINVRLPALTLQTHANSEGIHRKIASTQKLVEKSVEIVHRFARDLRPTVLDDLGLIPALKSYLKDFMERSGIRATLTVFAGVEELSSDVRTAFYRIVQEALINVANHSKATNAAVTIRRLKHVIRLEIYDDGNGFEVNKPIRSQSSQRLGLLGMRERVEMTGGQFQVESKPGQETRIQVDIPRSPADDSPLPSGKIQSIPLK